MSVLTETAVAEHTLTASELEQAHLYLEQTRQGVAGATKGLSDTQWAFKPHAEQWSIAENLEHFIFVQERVLGPSAISCPTRPPFPPPTIPGT